MSGLWGEEEADDRFADNLNRSIDAMSDRKVLLRLLGISVFLNALIWLGVLIFPHAVREGFATVNEIDDKLGKVTIALVFGLGMWMAYSAFRFKFPDIEDQRLDGEVMGSFAYHSHSNKRWMVWMFSVIFGVSNLLLLIFVSLFLTS